MQQAETKPLSAFTLKAIVDSISEDIDALKNENASIENLLAVLESEPVSDPFKMETSTLLKTVLEKNKAKLSKLSETVLSITEKGGTGGIVARV